MSSLICDEQFNDIHIVRVANQAHSATVATAGHHGGRFWNVTPLKHVFQQSLAIV